MKEKSLIKFFVIFLASFSFLFLAYKLWEIIIILIFVLFFYFLFNPIIKFLEKNNINRSVASFICVVGAIAFIFFTIFAILPKILNQLEKILTSLISLQLNEHIQILDDKLNRYLPFYKEKKISKQIEFIFNDITNSIFVEIKLFAANIFAIAFTIVLFPFLLYFFIRDNKKIFKDIFNLIPNKYFEASYYILNEISSSLGNFVRGWITDALFVGVLCGIGLSFISLPNSLALGIISGIGHLIPYFGPIIGIVPSILISLSEYGNFGQFPYIVIIFSLVYILDNGFFQPYIYYKNIKISPLAVILLIIVGGKIFGIYGMFLAVPFATAIKSASRSIYTAFKSFSIVKKS